MAVDAAEARGPAICSGWQIVDMVQSLDQICEKGFLSLGDLVSIRTSLARQWATEFRIGNATKTEFGGLLFDQVGRTPDIE